MSRKYRLTIEFCDDVCFCHWNYDPPVVGIGGGVARIGPGGSFGGFDYAKLRHLGPGTHDAPEFDERLGSIRGSPPFDEADAKVIACRFGIFCWANGVTANGDLVYAMLDAALPHIMDRIAPFVPPNARRVLHEWIRSQPPDVIPEAKLRVLRQTLTRG